LVNVFVLVFAVFALFLSIELNSIKFGKIKYLNVLKKIFQLQKLNQEEKNS